MVKNRIYFVLVQLIIPIVLCAGNVSELFKYLKLEGVVNCDTMLNMPNIVKGKPIAVEWNDNNPSHIGVSLFSKPVKDMVNHDVCNFVERLFLELSLFPTTNEGVTYLKRKKTEEAKNKYTGMHPTGVRFCGGVWQEKKLYGKLSMGVVRTMFIIDESGVIEP